MAGLTLQWNAVAPGVQPALAGLSRVLPHDRFYLAGGTALALLEGHRISVDIDIFGLQVGDPETLAARLERELEAVGDSAIAEGTVYLEIGGVKVSIIGYRYPLLEKPLTAAPDLIPIAALDDIAAMKLAAITARGARKDFVDLWTLVTRHQPLQHYLDAFGSKFAKRDLGHVIRSLTYFTDADREPPLRMIADVDWSTVKTDFRGWISALIP